MVSFKVQQTNLAKNAAGEIVEGGVDDIRDLYYVWALMLGETDNVWRLCDMHLQDSHVSL